MNKQTPARRRRTGPTRGRRSADAAGIVLLEVVLALTLFFAAASIILVGTNRSIRAVDMLRREAQAADLAVTLLSEIQMGLLEPTDAGPEAYEEPLEDWMWEVVTNDFEEQFVEEGLTQLEIVITHTPSGYTRRLVQWLLVEEGGEEELALSDPAGGGGAP